MGGVGAGAGGGQNRLTAQRCRCIIAVWETARACATRTDGALCSRVTVAQLHPYSCARMAMRDAIGAEDAAAGRGWLVVRRSDGRPGPRLFPQQVRPWGERRGDGVVLAAAVRPRLC